MTTMQDYIHRPTAKSRQPTTEQLVVTRFVGVTRK